MKLYFAGCNDKSTLKLLKQEKAKSMLTSYLSLRDKRVNFLAGEEDNIFLDSGAFSVFTGKAETISIQEYIKFIKENKFTTYAGLDVIGDPEETYKNCTLMKEAGLNPIPTFHYGTDLKWLKKYCTEYDYIAIGGMAGEIRKKRKILRAFLTQVFYTTGKKKLHGFGLTSNLLLSFPFYSVDSTAWLSAVRHRTVVFFKKGRLVAADAMTKSTYTRQKNPNILDISITNKEDAYLYKISIKEFLKFEEYVTRLWTARGITFED